MKVLALVSFKIFPPHMGGQKGVALFYRYLQEFVEVEMAASNDNTETIEASFPVHLMLFPNKKMARNYGVLPALRKLVHEKRIGCIIAEHSYTGWMGWLLRKRTGIPFIIHSHNLESYRFRLMERKWWRGYLRYEKWIHRQADHNFFISEEDRALAMQNFGLQAARCSVIPYGVEPVQPISGARERLHAALDCRSLYIFHFNGTLDYEPNIEAVELLLGEVNPRLLRSGIDYTIYISGKRLPQELQERIAASERMVYLDFFPDIELMYQGADVFLNPVLNDSGIKTKVVEALANHCTVVSTAAGAAGIPPPAYGQKMLIAADRDWENFTASIARAMELREAATPAAFFEYFSWAGIAARAARHILALQK